MNAHWMTRAAAAAATLLMLTSLGACVYELDGNGECCDDYGCYACDDPDGYDDPVPCEVDAECGVDEACVDFYCEPIDDQGDPINNDGGGNNDGGNNDADCTCEASVDGVPVQMNCGDTFSCEEAPTRWSGECLGQQHIRLTVCPDDGGGNNDPDPVCSCTPTIDGQSYEIACGDSIGCDAELPTWNVECFADEAMRVTACGDDGGGNNDGGDACSLNADCGEGEFCVDGACVDPNAECSADADCGEGESCAEGRCEPAEPVECTCSADCLLGQSCEEGVCVGEPIDRDGVQCQFDRECPSGVCLDGQCQRDCAAAADCLRTETCEAGVCVPDEAGGDECVLNADCGAGICVNGFCLDRCCESDQCEAGFACDQGVCRPGQLLPEPACRRNADCPDGDTCVDAACRAACSGDADCDALDACLAGYCVPQNELSPECLRSEDCGEGMVCRDGMCL